MSRIKTNLLLFFLISIVIAFFSRHVGMFWDNVCFASQMGDFLYENGIFNWDFPDSFDPGHPPLLATYLAIGWKIFGQTLLVSHLLMIPFIFGILHQTSKLVNYFISNKRYQIMALVLVLSDPTLFSQLTLVSPEALQIFFFLLTLNAILNQNLILKSIGLAFLGMVTYRGMMLCAGLFIVDFLINIHLEKKNIKFFIRKKNLLSYFFGSLPAIIFVIWRLTYIGWLQSFPESPYAGFWHLANLKTFFRNILVLSQRFIDFGRLSLFIVIIIGILKNKELLKKRKTKKLILISIFSTSIIILVSLLATNDMGHRYFIGSYISISLLAFIFGQSLKQKKIIYIFLIVSLWLGNLIVYPPHIAQGWDASLAHIPYWKIRQEAINYMDSNNIPIEQTATFFPNYYSSDQIILNQDYRSFKFFSGNDQYLFYSNIYNVKDKYITDIQKNYSEIKTFRKKRIFITIFKQN